MEESPWCRGSGHSTCAVDAGKMVSGFLGFGGSPMEAT